MWTTRGTPEKVFLFLFERLLFFFSYPLLFFSSYLLSVQTSTTADPNDPNEAFILWVTWFDPVRRWKVSLTFWVAGRLVSRSVCLSVWWALERRKERRGLRVSNGNGLKFFLEKKQFCIENFFCWFSVFFAKILVCLLVYFFFFSLTQIFTNENCLKTQTLAWQINQCT